MNLNTRIKLIPRNNWDYNLSALFRSLSGISKNDALPTSLETLLQQKPIWTTSGRASLYAILKALDLPPGAKVGVPLFCCSVVFNAICQAGLTPCFLDINPEDGNLSVDDLKKKQEDLAAVIVVHMFGNPCNMDEINAAAGSLPVIEDCAQSIFSTYKGKPTGTLSTASFFSFRCGKYISAGEGSAIICKDTQLKKKIEQVVDSFEEWSTPEMVVDAFSTFVKAALYNRPWYGLIGYPVGMRLDKKLNLTAKDGFEAGKVAATHFALANARIARFEEKIDLQKEHARNLYQALEPKIFSLPSESKEGVSNWFQFALRFHNTRLRDQMADNLFENGIDTAKYLNTIAEEAQEQYGYQGDCPNAEELSKTILLIPIHYKLDVSDISHLAQAINEISKNICNAE
jgi:perosamine synthetase